MNPNNIFRTITCSKNNKKYIPPFSDIQMGLITRAVFTTYESYRSDKIGRDTFIYGGMISVSFCPCLRVYTKPYIINTIPSEDFFGKNAMVEEIDIKVRVGDEFLEINDELYVFKRQFKAYKINTILQDENVL